MKTIEELAEETVDNVSNRYILDPEMYDAVRSAAYTAFMIGASKQKVMDMHEYGVYNKRVIDKLNNRWKE